jgi:hypothetical protein
VPASDGADDFVRISGPSEGLRLGIVFDGEAIDDGVQIASSSSLPTDGLYRAARISFTAKLHSGLLASPGRDYKAS